MTADQYFRTVGDIQALFRSRLKIQVIFALSDGTKTLAQLRDITGSSSQALSPKIHSLLSNKYIKTSGYDYQLTPIGRMIADKIQDIIRFILVIKKFKKFWEEHYTEAIPGEFFSDIGSLCNSEIITDTNVEIFNVYFNFLKVIQDSERIYILSPISSPAHTDVIIKRIKEGAYVETVMGKDLIGHLTQSSNFERIRELASQVRGKIFVLEEIPRVGLTVTEKYISLGLFKYDGVTYDTTMDLFSRDPKALKWGYSLYQSFREKAQELTFDLSSDSP